MSQNILDTNSIIGPVRVRAGWDVPLQELYCNVEALDGQELEFEGTPACFFNTAYSDVESMAEALALAGIRLPSSMLSAVRQDLRERAENLIREFEPDAD